MLAEEFLRKVRGVAKLMRLKVVSDRSSGNIFYLVDADRHVRIAVSHGDYREPKGKVVVWGEYPEYTWAWGDPNPARYEMTRKIGMSETKTPFEMVRDMGLRFMPEYNAILERALEKFEEAKAKHARQIGNLAKVAGSLGTVLDKSGRLNTCRVARGKAVDLLDGLREISQSAEDRFSVTLELSSDEAVKVLGLAKSLAEERKPAPGPGAEAAEIPWPGRR